MASKMDDIELQIIDDTVKTDTGRYGYDDSSQNRRIKNSVFYCYNKIDEVDDGVRGPIDAFIKIYQSGLAKKTSWKAQIDEAVKHETNTDEFYKQVAQKTKEMLIEQSDAILEVYTDRIVNELGNCNEALLWVSKQDISEFFAEIFVTKLLQRKADVNTRDDKYFTSLHYAAKKGHTSVVKRLMEHQKASFNFKEGCQTPLELAIDNDRDECATFLIKNTEPLRVRKFFQGYESTECRLKFHELLEKKDMQETTLAVLNTMMEPLEGQPGTYIVYYHILDGDQFGRDPTCINFDRSETSCLYKIANRKKNVVRLFLRHKWNQFARNRFLSQYIFYVIHSIFLTIALVLAARKADPSNYDEGIDIFRGICEVLLLLSIFYNLLVEIYQLKRNGCKHYFINDTFNYLDIGAIICPLLIIPFRIVNSPVQWVFASIGYLFQVLRGLEFAAVFKSTGTYVEILYLILWEDIIPFATVFSLFLFGFTGAFYFALRGEEITRTVVTSSNCTSEIIDDESCIQNFTMIQSSSLDNSPHLTEEYYHVLFSNLRVMIEGESVFDEYYGPDGFKWLSVIIYSVFLFLVITVLLNLLIAQMNNTYTNVQDDAQRSLFIYRAQIVAKVEQNSLFASALFNYRKSKYVTCEVIDNPHDLLDKWEAPPISKVSKEIKQLHDSTKQQETANKQQLNDINNKLKQLQDQIKEKEIAHEKYRAEMKEALNEQKQMIQKLISKKGYETDV